MKIVEYFQEIPKLFNWYFQLQAIKRVQLNYVILLIITTSLAYYNDKQHRENYTILSARMDTVNNSRTQEQEKYTSKLVYYTDKFNRLLEVLLEKKERQEEAKHH